MTCTLPDQEMLYRTLLRRDQRYEGRVWVCVASTGIFCRLTCPARKPNRENCIFHTTIKDCLTAGFRPCKRCNPMQPAATADPVIHYLLAALDQQPYRRFSEQDVKNMGYDPSTVRRGFRRQFGMTFLQIARVRRMRDSFTHLGQGASIITAQQQAGFTSASAFRDACARLLGLSPQQLARKSAAHKSLHGSLLADWIVTPLGDMIAVSSESHLHLLKFIDRKALATELKRLWQFAHGNFSIGQAPPTQQVRTELHNFFAGKSASFDTPLFLHGTPFLRQVWKALRDIPGGETCSYSELAHHIGRPSASRAVARANGANQIALVIPCHRVIGADGSLTGYGGGLWRKQRLLDIEQKYGNNSPKHLSILEICLL